ncbi:MAG: hypothetical protein QNJ20_13900 [Paracoccaceae bacterium]|nr:hypothetical protein [Paracoccaceae bacterium]
MRTVENSRDRLILEDTPWVRGTIIILAILYVVWVGFRLISDGDRLGPYVLGGSLLLGPVVFALFVERYQVIFLRPENSVFKRKRSIFGYKETRHDLSAISHARAEVSVDSDGGEMSRPVLIVQEGDDTFQIELVEYFATGTWAKELAAGINDWLGVEAGH